MSSSIKKLLHFSFPLIFIVFLNVSFSEIIKLYGVMTVENPQNISFINYTFLLNVARFNLTEIIIRDCKNLSFLSLSSGFIDYFVDDCKLPRYIFLKYNFLSNFSRDEILLLKIPNFSTFSQNLSKLFEFFEDFSNATLEKINERWLIFNGSYVSYYLSLDGLNFSVSRCKPPIEDVGFIISKSRLNPQNKEIYTKIRMESVEKGRVSTGFAKLNGTISPLNLTQTLRWYWDIPSELGGACNGRGCAFGVIIGDKEFYWLNKNSSLISKFYVSRFSVTKNESRLLIDDIEVFKCPSQACQENVTKISLNSLNIVGLLHWCDGWAAIEKIFVRNYAKEEENLKWAFYPQSKDIIFLTSDLGYMYLSYPMLFSSNDSRILNLITSKENYRNFHLINYQENFNSYFIKNTSIRVLVPKNLTSLGIYLAGILNSNLLIIDENSYFSSMLQNENIIVVRSLSEFYSFLFSLGSRFDCLVLSFLPSNSSILGSRYAFLYNCFPIFITYNNTEEIKKEIRDFYYELRNRNKLSNPFILLVVIGNYSEIPPYPIKVTSDLTIYSDYPYADINDDGYQDFPIRRLCCDLEEISIQIEAPRIANLSKNVLIAQSYYNFNESNIAQMIFATAIEGALISRDILKNNDYEVKVLTEHRLTSKDINDAISKLWDIIDKILKEEISFGDAIGVISKIFDLTLLFSNLNYEFDIYKFKPFETLNSSNFLTYANNSSIIFMFTPTEKNYYILPSNKTYKEKLNSSLIPFVEIFFDVSENSYQNTFNDIVAFSKLTYKNQTISKYFPTDFNSAGKFFKLMLSYNTSLSIALREARNREIARLNSGPAYIFQKISEDYKKNVIDYLNSIIFYGNDFQIIYKNASYQYSLPKGSKFVFELKDVCSLYNITINETGNLINITSFKCNFSDFDIVNFFDVPKILYYIQKKFELPQFESLKKYKINYTLIEINNSYPLVEYSNLYDIVLVNNSNDVQEMYLIIYPARIWNNRTYLLKDFIFEFEYDNSFGINNVYIRGNNLLIEIYSDNPRNVSIEILKENKTFIYDFKMIYGNRTIFYVLPEGNYTLRIKYFEISYEKNFSIFEQKFENEFPFYQKIIHSFNSFVKIFSSFFIFRQENYTSDKISVLEKTPAYELKIENSKVILKTPNYLYQRIVDNGIEEESIKTPYGYLIVRFENGNFSEIYSGNYFKIKEKLDEAREFLKSLTEKN